MSSVTCLVVEVLSVDDELVGGLLWRSKVHKADVTGHFLHAVSIQLNAFVFFTAIVIRHVESEPHRFHLNREQNHCLLITNVNYSNLLIVIVLGPHTQHM